MEIYIAQTYPVKTAQGAGQKVQRVTVTQIQHKRIADISDTIKYVTR